MQSLEKSLKAMGNSKTVKRFLVPFHSTAPGSFAPGFFIP
ncbi:MAG: hypothetical protein JWN76_1362, partial [Chitinophagaceae bacterium]|nr:hypothetical protein [Chitinophagaceae bacterium]